MLVSTTAVSKLRLKASSQALAVGVQEGPGAMQMGVLTCKPAPENGKQRKVVDIDVFVGVGVGVGVWR
jgi:hypothetical protein